jgi:hypothetical protein
MGSGRGGGQASEIVDDAGRMRQLSGCKNAAFAMEAARLAELVAGKRNHRQLTISVQV